MYPENAGRPAVLRPAISRRRGAGLQMPHARGCALALTGSYSQNVSSCPRENWVRYQTFFWLAAVRPKPPLSSSFCFSQVDRRVSDTSIWIERNEKADFFLRIAVRRYLATRGHPIIGANKRRQRAHRRISGESGGGTRITPLSSPARKNSEPRSPAWSIS